MFREGKANNLLSLYNHQADIPKLLLIRPLMSTVRPYNLCAKHTMIFKRGLVIEFEEKYDCRGNLVKNQAKLQNTLQLICI